MSSIDERVVQMKFDNSQFQKGVSDTNSALDKLKKGLNLDEASKSLDGLDAAGKRFSLAGVANGVDSIASKFSALSVIGITALASIAAKAVDVGLNLVKSITVEPIMDGLHEYETNLNSIQTILANTSAKGSTLEDVNAALNELNTYSDKTIYNFSEMARNIGTFTAAGVDLKTSTAAIKGISNLAALSGSNSQQAATAMYQLSQAMSTGTVKLMDWNSVVNAGMGGQVFQDAIKDTARAHGVAVDKIIKDEGSFRDSLQKGWLTSQILTDTLAKFTGDLNADQLRTMGYNDEQIDGILKMGQTAQDAATKIKTMSQLIGTLQETSGSGWATTWQLLFGDFEEAKVMFTNVNNVLSDLIQESSDARNKLLGDWKALGGRTVAIDAIALAFAAVMNVLKPLHDAFVQVFPPMTGKQLYDITVAIRDFVKGLLLGPEAMDKLKRSFAGVFAVMDIAWTVVKGLVKVFVDLFSHATKGSGSILNVTSAIGDFLVKVDKAIKNGEGLNQFFGGLEKVLTVPIDMFRNLAKVLFGVGDSLTHINADGFVNFLSKIGGHLKAFGDGFNNVWGQVLGWFVPIMKFFGPLGVIITGFFQQIGDSLTTAFKTMDFKPILDLINTGLLGGIFLIIRKFMKQGMSLDIGGGFLSSISGAFEGLTGTMEAMQQKLKADVLFKIAAAIGLLTLSVVALSMIDSAKLTSALVGLGAMFTELMGAMALLEKITGSVGFVKLPILTASLILLAVAIDLLVIAVVALGQLDWNQLAKGLTGVAVLLLSISAAMRLMPDKGKMISTGIGLIGVAIAVNILVSAVKDMSTMSWADIGKGLAGVAGSLVVIAGAMHLMPSNMLMTAASLVIIAASMKIFASAIYDMSAVSWVDLGKGLAGIAASLLLVAGATQLMPKDMALKAVGLAIIAGALKIMASAMKDMGGMSWEEIAKSMLVLGGSLIVLAAALGMMDGTLMGSAALLIAATALNVMVPALKQMGDLSWDQIMKAAVVLAGSLLIIAGALYLMEGGILGAAALIIVAGALAILTPVLTTLGSMSWDDIGRGLTVLAGALAIIGVAGLLLTPVIPTLLGLSTAIMLLGVGAVLVGVGLLAFSAGLTALSVSGAAGAVALVAVVTAIIGLIPMIFEQIGLGIVAFAKVLSDNVPTFLTAMVTLITALLTAINTVAPQIVQTLVNLLWLLVSTIQMNLPRFIDAGFSILISFLNGIGNNIGQVVDSAVNIVVNFINGIANNLQKILDAGANLIIKFIEGIGSNALKITNAAADTIITFVNGLADSIRTHTQALKDAGGNLAFAIIDGMTGGLASKVKSVADSAWDMGKKAIAAIKGAIDSNSPSKETYKLGSYFGDGFALGITTLTTGVEKAATNMGKTAVSAIKDSISNVASMASEEIDMTPTIRPVLDLSAIKKDSGLISGMITPPSLAIDGTYAKASSLAEATRNNPDVAASSDNTTTSSNDKLTLIQNNYSPKALSSAEIYRNTKNQLSVAKGVLAP